MQGYNLLHMKFQTRKLDLEIASDPLILVATIFDNNPSAVALAFKAFAGEIVNENDPEGMFETLQEVAQRNPAQADELVQNILSVPVYSGQLKPVTQDWVLEKLIEAQARNQAGQNKNMIFDPSIDELNEEILSTDNVGTTTDDSPVFNWGPIVAGVLPGILGALGITPQQNPQSNGNNSSNGSTVNWMLVIVAIVVVALIAFLIYRASKS